MTKTIVNTYNVVHEYRKKISVMLIAACVVTTLFYIFNVYAVISRTVAMQKINSQITATAIIVENLDAKYLGLSSKITPDSLDKYGMSQGKVSEYISKAASPTLGSISKVNQIAMRGYEL